MAGKSIEKKNHNQVGNNSVDLSEKKYIWFRLQYKRGFDQNIRRKQMKNGLLKA